jgi:hypothetical protein
VLVVVVAARDAKRQCYADDLELEPVANDDAVNDAVG